MAPNMHQSVFPVQHFLCTYTQNLKTKGHITTFYQSNNCLLSEISFFWVRAGCKTRIAPSFRYEILCVLTHPAKKLQVVYERSTYRMSAVLLD